MVLNNKIPRLPPSRLKVRVTVFVYREIEESVVVDDYFAVNFRFGSRKRPSLSRARPCTYLDVSRFR